MLYLLTWLVDIAMIIYIYIYLAGTWCAQGGLQNGPPRLEGKATNPPKVEHAFLSRQRERLEASCSVVTFFARVMGVDSKK